MSSYLSEHVINTSHLNNSCYQLRWHHNFQVIENNCIQGYDFRERTHPIEEKWTHIKVNFLSEMPCTRGLLRGQSWSLPCSIISLLDIYSDRSDGCDPRHQYNIIHMDVCASIRSATKPISPVYPRGTCVWLQIMAAKSAFCIVNHDITSVQAEWLSEWLYVCIYVCMYMYVCMYVCMYVYYVYILCMHACTHVCMYACMYVCMYVRIYYAHVCMYIRLDVCLPILGMEQGYEKFAAYTWERKFIC